MDNIRTAVADLLEVASKSPPDTKLGVSFALDETAIDWDELRKAKSDTERAAFINARKATIAPSQERLIAWLRAAGADGIEPRWATNSVYARVPAQSIPSAAAHPDVRDASGEHDLQSGAAWSGADSTIATRMTQLYDNGLTGGSGGTRSNRIRIGIIEYTGPGSGNGPPLGHRGWDRVSPHPGSRIKLKNCSVNPCANVGFSPTMNHSTVVTWTAAGSIEAGQDPAYPGTGTLAQRERSGHLKNSYIYWYGANVGTGALTRAVQAAIADGVDTLNMSLGFTNASGAWCDRFADDAGLNAMLQAALNAGLLPIACGGNSGPSGCTVWHPGHRAEVLAVNGLSTNTTLGYDALGMLGPASRGGMDTRSSNGVLNVGGSAAIDLVAPGEFTGFYNASWAGYASDSTHGCSLAAPVVAAMAGGLRSAFNAVGWVATDARMLMVNTLLMGDGWNADTGAKTSSRFNSLSGGGRVRVHYPSSQDLLAPWGWGWRSVTIMPGQDLTWPVGPAPIPASVTQWKFAAVWTPQNLDSVPDIDFYVEDTCPPGGGVASVVADTGYDTRARFRLEKPVITGRCLRIRARAFSVPPGGTTFYAADYFHSGNPASH